LIDIIKKSTTARSSEDLKHLMLHLMFEVSYFSNFSSKLILQLCEKLEYEMFKVG